jgi:hypothetical protein
MLTSEVCIIGSDQLTFFFRLLSDLFPEMPIHDFFHPMVDSLWVVEGALH